MGRSHSVGVIRKVIINLLTYKGEILILSQKCIKSVSFGGVDPWVICFYKLSLYKIIVPVNGTVFSKGSFKLDTLREGSR